MEANREGWNRAAMTQPKVSVLMPAYNTEASVLRDSIDSIINQSLIDFEFLILNDSPENSGVEDIVLSYSDKRIKYYKNSKNRGLEYSTNYLIGKSQGEYIAIFDHDDISLPDRLQKESEYLDRNPQAGMVSAQFTVFGQENWTSDNPTKADEIRRRLKEVNCISHTAMMVRRSVLIENDIKYEKSFFPAASYRVITKIALVTEVHNLPDILLMYRMDGNNTSIKNSELRIAARERVRAEYIEGLKTNGIKNKYLFDSVKLINDPPYADNRRYYKGVRNDEEFFIKSNDKTLVNEFRTAKILYDNNNKLFIEPIDYYSDKDVNYIVMRWCDGVGLDEFMSSSVKKETKQTLIQDLYEIFRLLRKLGIVHRDIIPRNFMVEDGRLILIDLYWSVYYDKYREYKYVEDNIRALSQLGEDFSAGIYLWDDAYSFAEIARYIAGSDDIGRICIEKISKYIGERVISPEPIVFHKTIEGQAKESERMRSKNMELAQDNDRLRTENEELAQAANNLKYEKDKLVNTHDRLLKSLSWRVTEPLRRVNLLVSNIRKKN